MILNKVKFWVVFVLSVLLGWVYWIFYYSPGKFPPERNVDNRIQYQLALLPSRNNGKGYSIAHYIRKYYSESTPSDDILRNAKFAQYLAKQVNDYKLVPSPTGLESIYDLELFLYLPTNLESDKPQVILFSNAFEDHDAILWRLGLILEGQEIKVLVDRNEIMEQMIGERILKETKPLLFSWSKVWHDAYPKPLSKK